MSPFVSKMSNNSQSGSMKGSLNDLLPQFPTTGPITKVKANESSLECEEIEDTDLLNISNNSFSFNNLIDLSNINDMDSFDDLDNFYNNSIKNSISTNPNEQSKLNDRKSNPVKIANHKSFSDSKNKKSSNLQSRSVQRKNLLKLSASRPELDKLDDTINGNKSSPLNWSNRSSSMSNLVNNKLNSEKNLSFTEKSFVNSTPVNRKKSANYSLSTYSSSSKQKEKFKTKFLVDNLSSPYKYVANRL